MKALCVDSSNLINPKGKDLLEVGKIYEIKFIENDKVNSDGIYHVIDETGNLKPFRQSRFVLLRDLNLNKLYDICNF